MYPHMAFCQDDIPQVNRPFLAEVDTISAGSVHSVRTDRYG